MSQAVAIVTGAGKRVGRVIAETLVQDGWLVVAHVHGEADDVPAGTVRAVADLSLPDCAERIFAACPACPSLLVNNAARFAPDDLLDFSPEEFSRHMAVNVQAPALLTSAFAERDEEGDRLIVNILDAKLAAPNPDYLSYTLSKAALATLTELSARRLAGRKVRVNGIAPALMLQSPGQSDENFARAHAMNPLARGVLPQDVVTALRFLLDSPAVTGEVLTVDGGQRFMSLSRDVQYMSL